MAAIEKARLVQLIKMCDMATGGGRDPLSDDDMAAVCSLATPFAKWSHRWRTGDDGSGELEIYNMDTGPDANAASGARFWPRADHDTDAAIELLAKIVPQPYRLDITVLEGERGALLNPNPLARLQKVIDGSLFDLSCQATVLPLAIVGLTLKAAAVLRATAEAPLIEVEDLPPLDDLPPPDNEDPVPSFEGLPD